MGREKTVRKPKYRKHSKGFAFVEFKGKRHYFSGDYNSPESLTQYHRFILDHVIDGKPVRKKSGRKRKAKLVATPTAVNVGSSEMTVAELAILFLEKWALKRFGKDRPQSEYYAYKKVLNDVVDFAGHLGVNQFRSRQLMDFQEVLIEAGQSVATIRRKTGKVKRFYRWAMLQEFIAADTLTAINAVPNCDSGRKDVKKPRKVSAISWDIVSATLEYMNSGISRAMVKFQWYTGARAENIGRLRPCEIDRSNAVWIWTPEDHKNAWRGQTLKISIGPQAQKILLESDVVVPGGKKAMNFLDREEDKFCFSPRESRRLRSGNNLPHPHMNEYYSTASYTANIRYALGRQWGVDITKRKPRRKEIEDAGGIWWHSHQLRHARCVIVRERLGVEAAAAVAGHKTIDTTLIYAPENQRLRNQAALELG